MLQSSNLHPQIRRAKSSLLRSALRQNPRREETLKAATGDNIGDGDAGGVDVATVVTVAQSADRSEVQNAPASEVQSEALSAAPNRVSRGPLKVLRRALRNHGPNSSGRPQGTNRFCCPENRSPSISDWRSNRHRRKSVPSSRRRLKSLLKPTGRYKQQLSPRMSRSLPPLSK